MQKTKNCEKNPIKNALIVCDSFKGSLTSKEVAKCVKRALKRRGIAADYLLISDGGEGYLDALKFGDKSLEKHYMTVCGPLFGKRRAMFLRGGNTLYFSLADTVGICLLKDGEIDAFKTSTYGLGELMRRAILKYGPQNVVLAIGGSCTNDLGLGMLEGLGAEIFSGEEKLAKITLKDFGKITRIDLSGVYGLTAGIDFTVLTDVINPLLGENGATFVYGRQKGLKDGELAYVDGLVSDVKNKLVSATESGNDPCGNAGSGAAGGVGFAAQAVFGAKIKSGIDELLKAVNFGGRANNYDAVITGEGCFDSQSLNGKAVCGVMKYGVKKLYIVSAVKKLDFENAFSVVPDITSKENSLKNPKKYLSELIERIFRD